MITISFILTFGPILYTLILNCTKEFRYKPIPTLIKNLMFSLQMIGTIILFLYEIIR